jgi:hypothetical protein
MIRIVVKEKTMPQLISRWKGILERGHAVSVYLKGGHKFHGELREDKKGYSIWNDTKGTANYIELEAVVAVEEFPGVPIV